MSPHGHCHLEHLEVTKLWKESLRGVLGSLTGPSRTSAGPSGPGDAEQPLESWPGDEVAGGELHCPGSMHKTHSASHSGWPGRVRAYLTEGGTALSAETVGFFFIHSRARIRAGQACSGLSPSWHIFHFRTSKFSCRVFWKTFNERSQPLVQRERSVAARVPVWPSRRGSPRPRAQRLCLRLAALGFRAKNCFFGSGGKKPKNIPDIPLDH